ncbi:MAG: hypothetical protein FJ087_17975 [Deltaproteobacteria bacterium]|nr:hypothetical protein [Deltaproteobacteria bacterium]
MTGAHADVLAVAFRRHAPEMDLSRWIEQSGRNGWSARELRTALGDWFGEDPPAQPIVKCRGDEIRLSRRAFAAGTSARREAALKQVRSALRGSVTATGHGGGSGQHR